MIYNLEINNNALHLTIMERGTTVHTMDCIAARQVCESAWD